MASPEKTNNLCGMPSPGADDMCSNFAPYAFKGFRFAPISLRETASPPLSAVAASLRRWHVGSGGMSDSRLTRGMDGKEKPFYNVPL